MAVKFGNNAATLLAANASSSATVLTVSDGSVFPTLSGADYTYVTLEDVNSNREIVKLTAISGNELTVVRAQDGSSARAFSTSDKCELRITAALLNAVSTETVNGTSARFKFTATANQTTFSGSDDNSVTLAYNVGYIDLYLSGIRLIAGSDYTASNGTSIVLAAGASVNDIIEIVSYGTFVLADIAINDMTDVNTTGVADGSILAYDNTDSRFEKSTILSQSSSGIAVVGNITATGTVDGRDVATDGTKLDGVEASADVTDATNVTAAGALMDSELTSIASVKALNQGVATGDSPTFATLTSTGEITANGGIALGDNDKATFGAGDDLQIYHDGSNSFITDTGTGNLYVRASNELALTSAAGEAFFLGIADGSSYLYHNGGVKLNTTSTGIDVTGGITTNANSYLNGLRVGGADQGNTVYQPTGALSVSTASGSIFLKPSGTTVLTATSTGIDVTGSVTADSLTVDTSAGQLDVEALGGSSVKVKSSGSLKLQGTGGSVDLINGSTEVLSTTSSGISVNGTATMDGLTVDTAAPFMSFRESGATKLFIGESSAVGGGAGYYDFYAVTGLGQRFFTNSVERMRIDSSGRLLVGQTGNYPATGGGTTKGVFAASADSRTDLIVSNQTNGSNAGAALVLGAYGHDHIIESQSLAQGGGLTFTRSAVENMRIDSSGNLLVGKTATTLSVAGTYISPTGSVGVTRASDDCLTLNRTGNDGAIASFYKDGTTVGSIGSRGGEFIAVGSGDTNLEFNFGSDQINPSSGTAARDNAINLGSSNARFKDLYLSGTAHVGNLSVADDIGHAGDADTYLSFENNYLGMYAGGNLNLALSASGASIKLGGSGAANTLDDYEEGAWTPALTGSSGTSGTAYTTQQGSYTKIGNTVTANFQILLSNEGTLTGTTRISGLPFSGVSSPLYQTATLMCGNTNLDKDQKLTGMQYAVNAFIYLMIEESDVALSQAIGNGPFKNNTEISGSVTYFTNS